MKATPKRQTVATHTRASIAVATPDHDAELIKKCGAWKEVNDRLNSCDDDTVERTLVQRFHELATQIAHMPATTENGVAAKVDALIYNATEEDFDVEVGFDTYQSVQISVLCDLRDRLCPGQEGRAT